MPKRLAVTRIEQLLQRDYAQRYLQRHGSTFAPKYCKTPSISRIHLIKTYDDPRTRAFVAFYDLLCGPKKLRIVGLAHSHDLRRYEYAIHTNLAKALRQQGELNMIPEPYWYDAQRGAFFVEYIAGPSLRSIIKRTQCLKPSLARATILWLHRLQDVSPSTITKLHKQPPFETLVNNLSILHKRHHILVPKLARIWNVWHARWEKLPRTNAVITHGDFNPMNIIVRKQGPRPFVTVIDFGRAHRGPKLWDLAAILSQCETSLGFHLSSAAVRNAQKELLKAWDVIHGKLSSAAKAELYFFERYFHLLAVTHFLIWGDEREPALRKQIYHLFERL